MSVSPVEDTKVVSPLELLGWAHTILGASAVGFGGAVLVPELGTPSHRLLGRAYPASVGCLLANSLLIYNLTGHVGPSIIWRCSAWLH